MGGGGGRVLIDSKLKPFFFFAEIKLDVFHSIIKECEFFLLLLFKLKVVFT